MDHRLAVHRAVVAEPGGGERARKRGHVAAVRDDGEQVRAEAGGDERDAG